MQISLGQNQSVTRAVFLSGGQKEEFVSLPLPTPRSHPYSLSYGPLPPSLKPAMMGQVLILPSLCCIVTFLHDHSLGSISIFKDSLDQFGPSIISLSQSPYAAKSLLPCKVTYSQIPGLSMSTSLGAFILPVTTSISIGR